MKIDGINKSIKIKNLLKFLFTKYGEDKFKIKNYWTKEFSSIGLTDNSEEYLVYISTEGLKSGCYYITLENIINENQAIYETISEYKTISLKKLEKITARHLKI